MKQALVLLFLCLNILAQAQVDTASTERWREAQYVHGDDSLASFILKELIYPDSAKKYRVSGEVVLWLEVSDSNTFDSIGIKSKPIGYGLEEEALRILKLTEGDWRQSRSREFLGRIAYVSIHFQSPSNDTMAFSADMTRPYVAHGFKSFHHYLLENLVYPSSAVQNEAQGEVMLRFVVCKDGNICEVEVISKKIGFGLEEAAVKVVEQTSGLWEPATLNGEPVNVRYQLPIKFQLY